MCGICGIVDYSNSAIDQAELVDIRDSMIHRGPDSSGRYLDKNVGLGHRRLSIIDLSDAATQPLKNEDGTVWAICNGEIYNYRSLKDRLWKSGHKFTSNTDSEVLVHGYENWGIDKLVGELRGMFAFSIWDVKLDTLWLVRDRLGVKPVFYFENDGKLIFASEIRALYKHVKITQDDIDPVALDYYLAYGYVPPDRSLVSKIGKLPPAHVLKFDKNGISLKRYWDVEFGSKSLSTYPDYVEQVDELLNTAVLSRMESDVPMGVFLSGGIDSGIVAAIAARNSGHPIKTFTAGFEGQSPDKDETDLARLVSDRYNTQHHELMVDISDHSDLTNIMKYMGEPFADISVLPFYKLSQLARDEISVALTGDGGDESFCGYYNVYSAYLGNLVNHWVPQNARVGAYKILSQFDQVVTGKFPLVRRLKTLMKYANNSTISLYDLPNWWYSNLRRQLYKAEWANLVHSKGSTRIVEEQLRNAGTLEEAEKIIYTDLHLRLPGDYLTKSDIASNMVALEVRSPFLDQRLVEFAASIPMSDKLRGYKHKALLRDVGKKYLPAQSIKHKKIGFEPPLADWLRGDLAPFVNESIMEGLCNREGLFDSTIMSTIVKEHMSGSRDHTQRLWSLVCLESWWRLCLDGESSVVENHK